MKRGTFAYGGLATDDSLVPLDEADATFAKISRRLVPLLFLGYLCAFLDRINVGFAQLQMKQALGFSDAIYGFGAGVFFVGYLLLEVPSNLLTQRLGARFTFMRIMVLWGLAAVATAFVSTPLQFYVLRFLLGAFEAGFFPGVILYLTYWYPNERRGFVTGQFIFAAPLGGVVGGPVSGWLMGHMGGAAGLAGWQWCFMLEGLPAVILGFLCLTLTDKPDEAAWLSTREKHIVRSSLAASNSQLQDGAHGRLREAFADPKIYVITLIWFSCICGVYTLNFWLPTIIKNLGVKDISYIGLCATLPYIAGVIGVLVMSWSSDRFQERRWHIAIANILAGAAIALSTINIGSLTISLGLLCISSFLVFGVSAVIWAVPSTYLKGAALAPGLAIISSVGITGGLVSPTIIGAVKTYTGSLSYGVYVMSAILIVGAVASIFSLPPQPVLTRAEGVDTP